MAIKSLKTGKNMPIEMVRSIRNSHPFEWMLENFWKKDARKDSGKRLERDLRETGKCWKEAGRLQIIR